ncbi:kinase/pyrophosphorylase [Halovulum dunhuangense]|uniref:Kinase/pyrophosphorylase n=1 Tax=Halovulum dunhuangense TaxID=1505036 RepID=A0A849KVJ0_9RHOB|nr:pyruvate, water dikinase regulatory protein [Halovulum dunhuangense]NNU79095.1 kinase/pyrophosphorylase [Halovulum dunhuangense]
MITAPRILRVLLLSDSTGETVGSAARAAISQFSDVEAQFTVLPFLRSVDDIEAIPHATFEATDIIVFTLVDPRVVARANHRAERFGIPVISLLDPLLSGIAGVLRQEPARLPGQQYLMNSRYLDRVAAIDFAIAHDDGLSERHLLAADVILVGVSRTSKTPTCIYLGYQGIRAANVPLVPGQAPPPGLLAAIEAGIPVIGLTASAARIGQVRESRLSALGNPGIPAYSDPSRIEDELVFARLFFDRYKLPVIDVTRRSIEETAASIRHILTGHT